MWQVTIQFWKCGSDQVPVFLAKFQILKNKIQILKNTAAYSCFPYEYDVYTKVAGGVSIPSMCWYGKEGWYEVIIMDHLGTSLDDLMSGGQIDQEKVFQYTPHMVCSSDE